MRTYLFLSICLLSTSCFAEFPASKLEGVFSALSQKAQVGMIVQNAKTGKILFERNANQYFVPASTLKVAVAAAGLYALGPDFRYETTIFEDKSGRLYLKFQGDPTLKIKDLENLLTKLPKNKRNKKHKKITIDDTAFEKPNYGPGWMLDDLSWYYQAPVSTIVLNENRVNINFVPNKTLGEPVSISVDDFDKPYFSIASSNVQTVSMLSAQKHCQLISTQTKDEFDFSGCWPIGKKNFFKIFESKSRVNLKKSVEKLAD